MDNLQELKDEIAMLEEKKKLLDRLLELKTDITALESKLSQPRVTITPLVPYPVPTYPYPMYPYPMFPEYTEIYPTYPKIIYGNFTLGCC